MVLSQIQILKQLTIWLLLLGFIKMVDDHHTKFSLLLNNIYMNFIQQNWQKISETLANLSTNTKTLCRGSVQAQVITREQYMKAHDTIFNICSNKDQSLRAAEILYKKYETLLTVYLMDIVRQLEASQGMTKVKKFREIWNSYKSYLKLLKHLFAYLDRFYIPNSVLPSLQKKGLNIYCQVIMKNPQAKLVEEIYLQQLELTRNSDYTNMVVLRQFIQIFVEIKARDKVIDPFLQTIQNSYIQVAGAYYIKKFKQLQNLPCGDYLKEVNILYSKQQQVFNKCYQYEHTKEALKKQFSNDLLLKYNENLLSKSTGLIAMLQNRQVENLKLLNSIYKKLDCFSENIKHRFSQYFEKQLLRFLSDKMKPLEQTANSREKIKSIKIQLIKELFKFNKDKLQLFEQCFPNNPDILNLYKFSVQKVINQYNSIYNISETLALYSDFIMRKKGLEWEEFQQELKQIFTVFNFLSDKDVYIKDYTEYLADRLIKGQSDDEMKDYQKSFISKLKQNCGVVYTSLVESILSDHTASKIQSDNFKKYLEDKYKKTNFDVRVFNEAIWPHLQLFELKLPEQMKQLQSAFEEYFKKSEIFKFKNFKWAHLLSKITFTLYLDKSIPQQKFQWCDISMNVLQGCLLYFVYRRRPYKVHQNELLSQFQTVEKQLVLDNLSILWNNPHPIIVRSIDETNSSYYEFNGNILAKRIRIQYTYSNLNLSKKHTEIDNDRSLAVEMAIVKVMKARKRLRFDNLMNQVIQILKKKAFNPTIKQIKESIQKMLQKDYLQRDSKDMSEYIYKQ